MWHIPTSRTAVVTKSLRWSWTATPYRFHLKWPWKRSNIRCRRGANMACSLVLQHGWALGYKNALIVLMRICAVVLSVVEKSCIHQLNCQPEPALPDQCILRDYTIWERVLVSNITNEFTLNVWTIVSWSTRAEFYQLGPLQQPTLT